MRRIVPSLANQSTQTVCDKIQQLIATDILPLSCSAATQLQLPSLQRKGQAKHRFGWEAHSTPGVWLLQHHSCKIHSTNQIVRYWLRNSCWVTPRWTLRAHNCTKDPQRALSSINHLSSSMENEKKKNTKKPTLMWKFYISYSKMCENSPGTYWSL